MRRWDEGTERDTPDSRAPTAARESLPEAIVGVVNAPSRDAVAYPTIRRGAARIGAPQRGSGCNLSAHTGQPARAIPAGWSDELPVGMELLGRPFDDARLVGLGYAFEQAAGLRRPPASTPSLRSVGSAARGNSEVRASNGGVEVSGRFDYDPSTSSLSFSAEVVGAEATDVHAVILRHADGEGRWSVAAQLSGPGVLSSSGQIVLSGAMRAQLEAGRLYLELVTRGQPVATARAPVVLQGR
jgi:hypothetical protein